MQQLHPRRCDLELDEFHADLLLDAGAARAHVSLGMVSSVDGAATVDGHTADLGAAADHVAFRALRDAADAILVGAGTVRLEGYGPGTVDGARRQRRRARGLDDQPRLVIVSSSLELDPEHRVFAGPVPPIVVTHEQAYADAPTRLTAVAELLAIGGERVDLEEMTRVLARQGLSRVLCEGGPTLNGGLLEAGVVDELFITVAPCLVGGDAPRIVTGPGPGTPVSLELLSVHEHDGELLLRHRVRSAASSGR
ncbi:MAG: dihydrofolate reductase family protein [Nitriliruptoraceae bacterium]